MDVTLAFFLGAMVGALSVILIHAALVWACEWLQRNWP